MWPAKARRQLAAEQDLLNAPGTQPGPVPSQKVQLDPVTVGAMDWRAYRAAHNRRRVIDVDTFRRWRRRGALSQPRTELSWINLTLAAITFLALLGYYRATHYQPPRRQPKSVTTQRHLASVLSEPAIAFREIV